MKFSRRHLPIVIAILFLGTMFALLIGTAWQESQTVDEAVHLTAGFSYLKTGDFRLNPEHPPLIKELAALPLLFTKVKFPINDVNWSKWAQYPLGSDFLYDNTLSPQTILFLGRLPIMLLTIVLGWLIFRTSRKLFGDWGGVVSVALYALDPNFIAHGGYVTTDVGFTLFSFLTVLRFQALLDRPTKRNVIVFAAALWIAAMSKYSIIAFAAGMVVVALLLKLREHRHPALQIKKWLKYGVISLPIVVLLTWSFYGFDIRRRADDPHVAELYADRITYLQQTDLSKKSPLVRFVMNVVGNNTTTVGAWIFATGTIRIPGYAFFRGAIAVVGHSIGGQQAFLHGQFRDTGWWYFFPVAMLIKTPIPTVLCFLAVISIAVMWIIRARRTGVPWRNLYQQSNRTWFLFLATALVFLAISMNSHLDLGWRYTMPFYPYFFVLAGALASPTIIKQRTVRLIVPMLIVVSLGISQLQTFPNELGYFNALAGGSANGHTWLLDSNLDWGQDLPKLASYMNRHHLTTIPFAYYGWARVAAFTRTTSLPTNDQVKSGQVIHGYAAISLGQLYRPNHQYDWLLSYTPVATVGSSIYIYQLP